MHKDEMVTKKFLIVDRRDRRCHAFEARERREKSPSMTIHHCPEPEIIVVVVIFIIVVVVVGKFLRLYPRGLRTHFRRVLPFELSLAVWRGDVIDYWVWHCTP